MYKLRQVLKNKIHNTFRNEIILGMLCYSCFCASYNTTCIETDHVLPWGMDVNGL